MAKEVRPAVPKTLYKKVMQNVHGHYFHNKLKNLLDYFLKGRK